jgi:SAM-dependent methyltransferase
MADAILEVDPEHVLDPGVGGGVLLRALGSGVARYGLDIDPSAVELARAPLQAEGGHVELAVGSFLSLDDWKLSRDEFCGVISNPPYVRHHNLGAADKALAGHFSKVFGTNVSRLAGSYVYFFLQAILRLRPGGRLVFITPAEFLDVRYGAAVKQALMTHCAIDEIIVLELDELAFDGVLTTSAITIATKREGRRRPSFKMTEARVNGTVERQRAVTVSTSTALPERPWTPLLPTREERLAPLVRDRPHTLDQYVRIRRGIASGDNNFFCLKAEEAERWGIETEFLVPVVLGSKDLPSVGLPLDLDHWTSLRDAGRKCWLFWCHEPKERLAGTRVLRYIEHGEELGLPERFNCRTRTPWYGVERVPPSDFFVTYMARERARFIKNEVGARCMTSLLNLWVRPGVDVSRLRAALEDPVNAVLLREFGRTYGGGLGKIEPGDVAKLPVPALA